ncbi:hypothetical protein ACFWY5_12235 [Nonomuraea sp. NPDC059007]|uniref:hypothetical protein n=1 Tax=Nonomuraea sp. NPDC059007 TaxID=3346692 RepID=UPI0036CCA18F
MQIRLVDLPDEVERAVALIAGVMTIVEDSGPRARRNGSSQVQRYLEVRLPEPVPPAPITPCRARSARHTDPGQAGPDPVDLTAWT